MGFGQATHLVKQGYTVKGFDVFPASVERFKAAGGMAATSLADSAAGNLYYIVMVANQWQAEEALFGGEGAIVPSNTYTTFDDLQGLLANSDDVYRSL